MRIWGTKVEGDYGIYDGFIRILYEDRAKTLCLTASGEEDDEKITLDDCLKLIGYEGYGCVYVIFDDWTHGEIYCYGNAPGQWYLYGETMGFA